ncbi:MAG TPA: phosphate ABC transporter substrate-binding protein PstS [Gemmataceae bacterium]|jgi:phosphate transport system substrate-binding protein|nr:phosphate ABC transporter substrate-binding protein PstS [Gemmataceae bacterium]
MRRLQVLAVLAVGIVLTGGSQLCQAQSLNGSGSTFVGPIMSKWAKDYKKAKDIDINYATIGSGSGIRQVVAKETDFGCTDSPLTDDEINKAKEAGGEVIHIPVVLGGVVPAYNLETVKEPLRFTGPVLADIFLGNIKKWNDPALKEINAGADLPDKDIIVLHRSDRSGSSAIFTDYLAKVSKDWKDKVGSGLEVKWPVGEGHKGTDDLAAAISKTPGAIGYVEILHALKKKIQHAKIKNQEGNFVQGSLEGVTAAAEGALTNIPDDLRFTLTNAPGKDAYPISGATWAVVFVKQTGDRGQRLADFLTWVTHDGQESVTDLYYARLPKGLVQKAEEKLKAAK